MTQRLKFATPRHLFFLLLLLGALALPSLAQEPVSSENFSPAPYKVGERLTYSVSFASFVSAAHIELLIASRGTFFGRDAMQLKAHVETIGTVNAALYALNNDYVTYIYPASGQPFYSQQIIRSASQTSENSAEFNQAAGTAAIPERRTAGVPGTYDLISAVYRVRALPLHDGDTYRLSVRGESDTFDIEVHVKGRRVIKTNVGSFDTVMAEIDVKDQSRADNIRIFFSDDQRHVPVLLTAKVSAGEIRAELAGSEFIPTVAPPPGPTPTPVSSVQPEGSNGSSPENADLANLPFRVGEQLNYQVFLPTITQPAGQATFQVKARSKYFDRDGLLFTLGAQTTNALQHLFFASDLISSYVDPKTLLPFQSELKLSEGRARSETKLKINQDYGAATTEKGDRIEIPVGTHDYLSFFYALRTFNLAPPRRSAVSILVNNKPKTLFISALSKERIQLGTESIPAVQISLTTDDPQADKYQLKVWISEDRRRLPLRITAMTKLGALRADLAIIPAPNL